MLVYIYSHDEVSVGDMMYDRPRRWRYPTRAKISTGSYLRQAKLHMMNWEILEELDSRKPDFGLFKKRGEGDGNNIANG